MKHDKRINAAYDIALSISNTFHGLDFDELQKQIEAARSAYTSVSAITEGRRFSSNIEVGNFSVGFPLHYNLKADVTCGAQGEYIHIRSGRKSGSVKRSGNVLGLGAQTGLPRGGVSEEFEQPVLIIELFPTKSAQQGYNHRFTDRGLCWVSPGNPSYVSMSLKNWHDPSITADKLVGFARLAEERAKEVIEGVLAAKNVQVREESTANDGKAVNG